MTVETFARVLVRLRRAEMLLSDTDRDALIAMHAAETEEDIAAKF